MASKDKKRGPENPEDATTWQEVNKKRKQPSPNGSAPLQEEIKNLQPVPRIKSLLKLLNKRVLAVFLIIFISIFVLNDLRSVLRLSSTDYYPVSTQILDRSDKLIYEIYTEKRRNPVKLEELPLPIRQATIAIEDKDFYKHIGIDPLGVARAVYKTVFKRKLEGGSTITQQLVKTTLLSPERTILRKAREVYLSLVIEIVYPKDKILELYLNQVPYGGTAYGIDAAAQTYFGKGARDLTLAEGALLAGLTAAPTRFSPFGANPNLAKERQLSVLRRMVEDKYINEEEAESAIKEQLVFRKPKGEAGIHFALLVKETLVEEFGEKVVEQGGLRVRTTLDLPLQRMAEEVVRAEVDKLKKQKVGNGAALVTSPQTGDILAMVGSKDYFAEDEDGKVNVTTSPRQPGSSIKPLNYALGLVREKITPSSIFLDVPSCFQVPGQPLYCPDNYDGSFHGMVTTRLALGNSYNLPAVKMLALNGVPEFVTFARRLGLTTLTDPARYGLSLTLGGGEVKMTDMAVAFGVFANRGIKQDLRAILEIKDWQGKVLKTAEQNGQREGEQVLPPEVPFLISDILRDNDARTAAFGPTSYLVVSSHPEVSVKTGTTNDRRDNWTIGYTKDLVAAAWVGNNDNKPMAGAVSGVSGASPIWNRIMKAGLDRIEAGEIPHLGELSQKHSHPQLNQPPGVIAAEVCTTTGAPNSPLPPAEGTSPTLTPENSQNQTGCQGRFEYFIKGTENQGAKIERRGVHIDKTTGQLVTEMTLPENQELQEKTVIFDALGNMYCLDCTPPTTPVNIKYPLEIGVQEAQ